MYYAEYWLATGTLQREGPDPMTPANPSLSVASFATAPDRTVTDWNAATHTFDARPAPALASPQVGKVSFLRDRLGFTALANALAFEASDPKIAAFRMMLDNADVIHLDDPTTINGLRYLQSKGVLTDADVTRILTP